MLLLRSVVFEGGHTAEISNNAQSSLLRKHGVGDIWVEVITRNGNIVGMALDADFLYTVREGIVEKNIEISRKKFVENAGFNNGTK